MRRRRSRYSTADMARRAQAVRDGRFVQASPESGKLRCSVCTDQSPSAYGYHGGAWMDAHLGEHAACPDCGKIRPVVKMRAHRGSRWHKGEHRG